MKKSFLLIFTLTISLCSNLPTLHARVDLTPPPTGNDTIPPTAVCQDVTVYIDAAGSSIDPSVLDGGSTDNCGVVAFSSNTALGCSTPLDFYAVDQTGTFAPETITGTAVNLGDDENSPNLSIGFDFDFFGTTYTTFNIASNGLIGFGFPSPAPNIASTGCCLGQSLPNAAALNNLIAFAWEDLSPNLGGTIEYATIGTAPNRKLIVNFSTIAFFNGAGSVTAQVQLHEGSNIIEIHTTNITTGGVNQGLTVGIENATGTSAVTQPGFNQTTANGTIKTNDYVAFIPSAAVELIVSDTSGNTSTCTAVITIFDTIAPTPVCQDISVQLDTSNQATIIAADIDGGSTDNCGIASFSIDQDSFTCASPVANTVTLSLVDTSGNSSSCTATVTVEDTVPPTLTCQDVTVSLSDSGTYDLTSAVIVSASSDNCGIDTITLSTSAFTCVDTGTVVVTATATDLFGTQSTCTANVTLEDDRVPDVVCNDLSVTLDITGNATIDVNDISLGTTDNCGIDTLFLDFNTIDCNTDLNAYSVIDTGTFSPLSGTGTTVSLNDDENSAALPIGFDFDFFGNTYNTFHISSNGLIGFNFPSPGSNLAQTGCCLGQSLPNASILNDLIAFAWEDLSPNLGGTISYFTTGTSPNQILVVDIDGVQLFNGAGNVTCQVHLYETSNHIEIHTTNLTTGGVNQGMTVGIENASGTQAYTQPGFNQTTSNGTLKTNDFVAFYPATEVTLTATDISGNTATCTAAVAYTEVADTFPPTMVCQDITVALDSANQATITPADVDGGITDNCQVDSLSIDLSSFDCSSVGPVNVTLTAIDRDGNMDSCTAVVTVSDTTQPVITCPADTSLGTDAGICGAVVTYSVGSTDNCSATLSQTAGLGSGSTFPSGVTTESYSATDIDGNIASCSFTITVTDTEGPVAVCQDLTVNLDAQGSATITTSDVDGGSTDNCGIQTQSLSQASFSCSNIGANTLTLTVTDSVGQVDSCTATATVQDTIAPDVVCRDLLVVLDANGLGTITQTEADNGSSDACGISSISTVDTLFDCNDLGVRQPDTLMVTDANGNTASCNFSVQVLDLFVPTAACQNVTVFLDGSGSASITTGDIDNGSTDNCGVASLAISDSTFDCNDLGGVSITLTVTDVNGLAGTCAGTVTVADSTAPTAMCQDLTLNLDANGTVTTTAGAIDMGSTDNCGITSTSISQSTFDCSHLGANTVTLSAMDAGGNTGTCISTVTIQDTILPTAVCVDLSVYLDANGQANLSTGDVNAGSSDNCTLDSLSLSMNAFDCQDAGTTSSVTLTVMDPSGNTSTCSSQVTVVDSTAPVMACADISVYLDNTGNASITPTDVNAGSSDNCGIDTLTINRSAFTCADIGAAGIMLTARDFNGNMASCIASVEIWDTIAPTVNCQDFTLYLDNSGSGTITPANVTTGIPTDNCSQPGAPTLSQTTFVRADTGVNSVTVTVTDSSGNTASCLSQVTVIDSFFVGIEEALSSAGWEMVVYPNPTAGDLFVEILCESCSPADLTQLRLTNLAGQVLQTLEFEWQGDTFRTEFDLRDYAVGTYILSLHQNGQTVTKRIVKH